MSEFTKKMFEENISEIQTNKAIILQYQEALKNGELKKMDELLSADFKFHFPGDGTFLNKKETLALMEAIFKAFPKLKMKTIEQIGGGDLVVVFITVSGLESQIKIREEAVEGIMFKGVSMIYRLTDGKIKEEWSEFNLSGMMQILKAVSQTNENQNNKVSELIESHEG